jgi:heme-degrading monooxygenase HmoA
MFIAMNRFKVVAGRESDFEESWRSRETFLQEVPGFVSFMLLRNDAVADGVSDFISHTTWANREAFDAWRAGQDFRRAHAQGGGLEGVLMGPPEVALYNAVIEQSKAG